MGVAFLLRPLALDRDAGQIGDLLDEGLLVWRRPSRLTRVDREGGQHPAIRGADRRRPARAQPMGQRQVSILRPERILGDVSDDDLLVAIRGRSA